MEAIKPSVSMPFSLSGQHQAYAPLALHTLSLLSSSGHPHNQVQQFAPGGAGRQLRCRRCARRYAALIEMEIENEQTN